MELLNLRRGKSGRSQGFRPLVVLTMALVVDDVAEMVLDMKPLSTSDGRFLARAVARLVESVHHVAFRFVPTGTPMTPPDSASGVGREADRG